MVQAPSEVADGDDYQRLAAEQAILAETLVAGLGFSAGARVLDIGCGTGLVTLAAARRRATVLGIDIDEHALGRARVRAAAEGLDDIEFRLCDARQMPFVDASFDVVLSTFGLVFFPDQEGAARDLARIVRPGGIIALTAYSTHSIPSQLFDLAHELSNSALPAYPHYTWSQGPRAGALLRPYFEVVRVRYENFDTCFPSAKAWVDHVARWNPNMRKALANWPQETADTWRAKARQILEPYNRATDGTYIADITYAVITGVRKS